MTTRVYHSPIIKEGEPRGSHKWRYTPACSCGWALDRTLPASLCLDEWMSHLRRVEEKP